MTAELTLHIPNMTCASCARRVREAIYTTEGIQSMEIDAASRTVRITIADSNLTEQLMDVLAKVGYAATQN